MLLVRHKPISIVAVLLLSLLQSFAQNSDWGSWTAVSVTKALDRSYVSVRGELRTYDNFKSTEALFFSAEGGHNFTKWLKLAVSYEFWKLQCAEGNPDVHKGILIAIATLKRENLALSLREKYEFTYNAHSSSIVNILRSRLRGQYSVGRFTPYLMYEFFNDFEGHGWVRSLHYVGSEFKISQKHVLDLFYMYNLYDTDAGVGGRNILGLSYYFTF